MNKKSMLEKLALPMFATGVLAMIISASISVSASASASNPVSYKKITLNYLASGYSSSSSSCGGYQQSYGSNVWNSPEFDARDVSNSMNQKFIICQATLYVVTDVQMPTPAPTVTVIYKNGTSSPTASPRPTYTPTYYPTPTPTVQPTVTPKPYPTWLIYPSATPRPKH